MTTRTVSLIITELRTATPKHCVAAPQLCTRTLPQPKDGDTWQKFEVMLEGDTIVGVKTSGSVEADHTYVTPGKTVPLFGFSVVIGDNENWKLIDATSRPPVYALFSAMQGNVEDPENDGPFVMNTIKRNSEKPNLRLVGA